MLFGGRGNQFRRNAFALRRARGSRLLRTSRLSFLIRTTRPLALAPRPLLLVPARSLLVATGALLAALAGLVASRPLPLALARLLGVLAGRTTGALLELADFLVHEPLRLALEFQAHFIVPAVWATLPSFRIGFLAGGTENAFRERHRETARIVHFGPWTKPGAGLFRRSSIWRLKILRASAGTIAAPSICCGSRPRRRNCASSARTSG